MAAEVDCYDNLRNLMILEQFKNSVPERIATYISEHKFKSAAEAAALADDYVLTHGGECWHPGVRSGSAHKEKSFGCRGMVWPGRHGEMEQRSERGVRESDKICHYCHKKGHLKRDCFALKSRHKQAGAHSFPSQSCALRQSLNGWLKSQVVS